MPPRSPVPTSRSTAAGLRSNSTRHAPRKRGIQYAAAYRFKLIFSGIQDHPLSRVMTTRLRSSGSKLFKSCSYLGVGGDISSIDRCHRSVQDQQLFLARDIPAALRLAFD